jgi:ABC-type dipeptide/oligopeptide/nickel transport system ATPase component
MTITPTATPTVAAPARSGNGAGAGAAPLLQVENLKTYFNTPRGISRAVDGVSFTLERGKTLAIVGESGCGKSMTALSILQLVPEPAGFVEDGRVLLEGRDLLDLSWTQMRAVRGDDVAMIFQEPMTSLNPTLTIGYQVVEAMRTHGKFSDAQARTRARDLLARVGLEDRAEQVLRQYPHELSGGMSQRVMIAIALANEPKVLIADEPTTALDVTVQAQILHLLRDLQKETGMAVLLITHDLGIVSEMSDDVAVMYAASSSKWPQRAICFATRSTRTRKGCSPACPPATGAVRTWPPWRASSRTRWPGPRRAASPRAARTAGRPARPCRPSTGPPAPTAPSAAICTTLKPTAPWTALPAWMQPAPARDN